MTNVAKEDGYIRISKPGGMSFYDGNPEDYQTRLQLSEEGLASINANGPDIGIGRVGGGFHLVSKEKINKVLMGIPASEVSAVRQNALDLAPYLEQTRADTRLELKDETFQIYRETTDEAA